MSGDQHRLARRTERHAADDVVYGNRLVDFLSLLGIPKLGLSLVVVVVIAAVQHQLAVGTEGHGRDVGRMQQGLAQGLPLGDIPHLRRLSSQPVSSRPSQLNASASTSPPSFSDGSDKVQFEVSQNRTCLSEQAVASNLPSGLMAIACTAPGCFSCTSSGWTSASKPKAATGASASRSGRGAGCHRQSTAKTSAPCAASLRGAKVRPLDGQFELLAGNLPLQLLNPRRLGRS